MEHVVRYAQNQIDKDTANKDYILEIIFYGKLYLFVY